MREIKFRAWHKYYKQMVVVDWIQLNYTDTMKNYKIAFSQRLDKLLHKCVSDYATEKEVEIVQFTGLYDSTTWENLTEKEREQWVLDGNLPSKWNGKEIYEGDIVKLNNEPFQYDPEVDDPFTIGDIIWDDDGFWDTNSKVPVMGYDSTKDMEIIGNIYENPELLDT